MNVKEFKQCVNFKTFSPGIGLERLPGSENTWAWRRCGNCSYMIVCRKTAMASKSPEGIEAKCSANQGKLFRVSTASFCNRFKPVTTMEYDVYRIQEEEPPSVVK